MKKICGGNLFWGMQFRTCENFWDFADAKSSLNPKIFHKYKSHTAITSIVLNAKYANSAKSKQSKRLRCCFGLFLRETSEIGLNRPLSAVLCKNNPNEYPRPNCKQHKLKRTI